jgi:hypothetical protein
MKGFSSVFFKFLSLIFYRFHWTGLLSPWLGLFLWFCFVFLKLLWIWLLFWFLSQHVHYWYIEELLIFVCWSFNLLLFWKMFGEVFRVLSIGSYHLQIGIIWIYSFLFVTLLSPFFKKLIWWESRHYWIRVDRVSILVLFLIL